MVGALIGVQTASAATSRIVLYGNSHDRAPWEAFSTRYEATSFNSTTADICLDAYARLYVDDEWRAWRYLDFNIYDSKGNLIFNITRSTSILNGYVAIGLGNDYLCRWNPGDYILNVSYPGNERKGWPATSTTAIIHHTIC